MPAALVWSLGLVASSRTGAQLSLRDAFREADRASFANRIAAGQSATQDAQALSALQGVLPTVRFDAGYLRTTDPIGVFGSTLRQRSITAANFDPQRLNYPPAVGNYQAGIVVEQPLINPDAWPGRKAAQLAARATHETEAWSRLSVRVDVVRAYYGATLAAERVSTLQSAARAAHAHVAQADAMLEQGLVTKSDALLAAVRADDMDAQLVEAQGAAVTARRQLAVILGRSDEELRTDLALPTQVPSTARIHAAVAADTAALSPQIRADVRAASDGLSAARREAAGARSALLPRVNGFARYDWNSASRFYGGDRVWTAGVMASWSPFSGAREIANIEVSAGRAVTAQAQADAALANARLDVEQTRTSLGVALAKLDIAERAVLQSTEAHRIVNRKYEGGLATIVELLDAQAVETQSAVALSQARWSAIVAAAERRRALGRDPATLASLEDAAPGAVHDGRPDR